MKNAIRCAALFLLCFGWVKADDGEFTEHLLNGRGWKKWSAQVKISFLLGVDEAVLLTLMPCKETDMTVEITTLPPNLDNERGCPIPRSLL